MLKVNQFVQDITKVVADSLTETFPEANQLDDEMLTKVTQEFGFIRLQRGPGGGTFATTKGLTLISADKEAFDAAEASEKALAEKAVVRQKREAKLNERKAELANTIDVLQIAVVALSDDRKAKVEAQIAAYQVELAKLDKAEVSEEDNSSEAASA